MQQSESHNIQDDEISIVDILRFLSNNWKFLVLVTAGLSAIAITLSLLQPKQYQKQLTLSVKPTLVPVTTFPVLDVHQVGSLAVGFLQNSKLNQTIVKPVYDPVSQQISLTVRSSDATTLDSAGLTITNQLKTGFEEIIAKSLQTSLTATEIEFKRKQQILKQLEQQKPQFAPTNEYRLGAVETYQVQPLADIAQLEFDKQYLEQAQKNVAEFTTQFLSIQILSESETPQSRSPLPVLVISVIASFIAAVIAAIIRDQISQLKAELSGNKTNTSQNV